MRRLGGNLWIFAVMSSSVSKMRVITMIAEAQAQPYAKRRVLVPTMGALHKAHGERVRVASKHAGHGGEVALSIFVNPLQFEPGSDYERYPRSEKTDEEFCRNAGVDLLFRPSVAEMYADDRSVFVEESFLSNTLEGKSRPGISAAFARSLQSYSTFFRLTPLCLARRIFSNSSLSAVWCATSISRPTSLQCLRCAKKTVWHAVRAISI
jgi:Panthothenate synthetase